MQFEGDGELTGDFGAKSFENSLNTCALSLDIVSLIQDLSSWGATLHLKLKVANVSLCDLEVISCSPSAAKFVLLLSLLVVDNEFEDKLSFLEIKVIFLCRSEEYRIQGFLVEEPFVFSIVLPASFALNSICNIGFILFVEDADSDGSFDNHFTVEVLARGWQWDTLGALDDDLATILVLHRPDQRSILDLVHHFSW